MHVALAITALKGIGGSLFGSSFDYKMEMSGTKIFCATFSKNWKNELLILNPKHLCRMDIGCSCSC